MLMKKCTISENDDFLDYETNEFSNLTDDRPQDHHKCICAITLILSLLAIASICIIKLTEWRPLGEALRYQEINEIIVNISYSYIAATIFYFVMDYLPNLHRKKIMRRKIKSYLVQMKVSILQCIKDINLYNFIQPSQILSRKDFIKQFSSKDLTLPCDYLSILQRNKIELNLLVDFLLTIQNFLSDKEFYNLLIIKDSLFLTQSIRPIDYIETEHGERIECPENNQEEIAKSIYDIYELIQQIEQ